MLEALLAAEAASIARRGLDTNRKRTSGGLYPALFVRSGRPALRAVSSAAISLNQQLCSAPFLCFSVVDSVVSESSVTSPME
jgi:hypothetical protein